MNVRKVVLIAVAVNLAFVAAIGGFFWSQRVAAQGGSPPEGEVTEASAAGIVSQYISYQGVVTDDAGNGLQGSHDLAFTLYSCRMLPTQVCTAEWSDTYTLALVDGLFSVRLGPLDPTLFQPRTLIATWYLAVGMAVDGGAELSPLVKLNSTVPWAFTSIYAENMAGPSYDSGWIDSDGGILCGGYELTHNLGGSVDDYLVDLECRRTDGWGTYDCMRGTGVDASWYDLTDTAVEVDPCVTTIDALSFRLRIWATP